MARVPRCDRAFTVRADAHGGRRLMRLNGGGFVGWLMQHVLPPGIKRIGHCGVLASACKGADLDAARLALGMPLPNPSAQESARDFMARVARTDVQQCPCCALQRLRCVARLLGSRRLPAPGGVMMPLANWGPPWARAG